MNGEDGLRPGRLQRWALIAEVAGGLAVLVTLGFLAIQMRENNNALHAQTYQALMSDLNAVRAQALNPYAAALEQKLADVGWDGLTPTEIQGVRTRALQRWGIYESAYYANLRGVLGPDEWERFHIQICRAVENPGAYWAPPGVQPTRELMTPQFVDFVENQCP